MKTAIVLGATGHVGSYMVPALVNAGYQVTAISRSEKPAYTADMPQWKDVNIVHSSRADALDMIAKAHPDVILDLICYTEDEAKALCEALYAEPGYENVRLISIGSVWIYGQKLEAPVTETHPRVPFDPYGWGKVAIARYLMEQHREKGLKVTVLHLGHVCGKGWVPIGPKANHSKQVLQDIADGKEIELPDLGQATVQHVHSADIASLALACINNDASIGEEFHSVCETSTTLYGLAVALYQHFGYEPKIRYTTYENFLAPMSEVDRKASMDHIGRSPNCSLEKAKKLLGFTPKYSVIETVLEAVDSLHLKG